MAETFERNGPLNPVTLFMLHFLGGSAREWLAVRKILSPRFQVEAVDLAGFGMANGYDGWTVEEMANDVTQRIRETGPAAWMIIGHSMGAKIAAVIARQAEDGEPNLAGLCGVVLLAGSPPEPEPMDEQTRDKMREWFLGPPEKSRKEAEGFIRRNIASDLDPGAFETAVQDVLACNPAAWRAWLDCGSREDWAGYVGILNTPTLLVAGEQDGPLGATQQAKSASRHFSNAQVVIVAGAKHLLPLECPEEVADLIAHHWQNACGNRGLVPADYLGLIRSSRTSARTRRILLNRLSSDTAGSPSFLTQAQLKDFEALVDRIVPQTGPSIPLARHIQTSLAEGIGDGWRFAILNGDKDACLLGLQTLDAAAVQCGSSFAELGSDRQDELLERASRGALGGALDPEAMRRWFEDIRAEVVRAYVSHPATLARIGYGGIANGGDGVRKQGFSILTAGERELWEPLSQYPP